MYPIFGYISPCPFKLLTGDASRIIQTDPNLLTSLNSFTLGAGVFFCISEKRSISSHPGSHKMVDVCRCEKGIQWVQWGRRRVPTCSNMFQHPTVSPVTSSTGATAERQLPYDPASDGQQYVEQQGEQKCRRVGCLQRNALTLSQAPRKKGKTMKDP